MAVVLRFGFFPHPCAPLAVRLFVQYFHRVVFSLTNLVREDAVIKGNKGFEKILALTHF
jgi:hypothetical protein